MSVDTVQTRVFIISDTHSHSTRPHILAFNPQCSFRPPFPKADVLLHTGDLTETGTIKENNLALQLLASIPAELKLVIAGNHDLTLDQAYYAAETSTAKYIDSKNYDERNANAVQELWTGKAAREAGVTYLTEGVHEFTLKNGAHLTVYASPWQPECML
jgi:predicted MPP superfamily phosphohydrolase